jgi:hypothetical protein
MRCKSTALGLILSASLLLVAACSDDEKSPTDPAPEPQIVEQVEVTTTIVRFEALNDGDGIEGSGEFRFTVEVAGDKKSWERTVSSGNNVNLDWTTTERRTYRGTPVTTSVGFWCSEIDKDITGREYNDGDMNFRSAEAEESVPAAEITNYITLGNDECKVRLHYTIKSKVVEVQI